MKLLIFVVLILPLIRAKHVFEFAKKGHSFSDIGAGVSSSILKPSPHIVGGSEVDAHSHPYAVSLKIQSPLGDASYKCGGALLSPTWVLSASHCVKNDMMLITAYLGVHDLNKAERTRQVINVIKTIWHPHWDSLRPTDYDISLMRLARNATINEYVQPIRLPSLSQVDNSFWQYTATMVGWGKTGDNSGPSSTLLSADEKIVSNVYCYWQFPLGVIKNSHICVDGSNRKGVCNGDSGGPLVITEEDGRRTVIGVTSFGHRKGCEHSYPTVFTRVTVYLDWISNATGIPLKNGTRNQSFI